MLFILSLCLLCTLPTLSYAANSLHLTGTRRTSSEHDYDFSGKYDIVKYNDTAERIGLAVKGKYRNGVATETLTIFGPSGQSTFTGSWSCAKDPWLHRSISCLNVSPQTSVGLAPIEESDYFSEICKAYQDSYCFLSRKLVPDSVAKWMHNGPPAPQVSGVNFTHDSPVQMTLHYAANLAMRFYLEQWYCPPGKDKAPAYVPNGTVSPFPGDTCKVSEKGPLALSKASNAVYFGIGKPAGQPKNGTWYVRASLDSDSYGRSLWSHWHKTKVQLAMHFKDAPNHKPAPTIIAPTQGYVWNSPNTQVTLQLKSNLTGKNINSWSYDIEWERQHYVTKANIEAYNKLNKGGWPTQSGATEDMHPWSVTSHYTASSNPVTLMYLEQLNYQEVRPRSVEVSYRYRVRARVNNSQWSAWRYFIVEDANTKSSGMSRSYSSPDSLPSQPPQILSPGENQVIAAAQGAHNKYIKIIIHSNVKNAKPDHWRYQLQWKRALYYTKANNDMYYCKHGQPKKNEFPRQMGVVHPPQVWDGIWTPNSGNLSSGDAMWDPQFILLSPKSTEFSYMYQFRARAQRISPEAYGPWSPWRSFIVENTGFNTCTAVKSKGAPNMKVGGMQLSSQSKQQSGQSSQQHNSQQSKIRFGAKVMNRTTPKTGLPAVQQHAMSHNKIRFGGKLNNKTALNQQAPAMQTMSGHLNSSGAPKRYAGAGSAKARKTLVELPHLKILNNSESVDASCANLAKFITLRETVINEGGPLAAGHAKLYIKEYGGAHIVSQPVPVPVLAHGASTTLTLMAGTQGSYRGKIPGRHVLPLNIVVNGKTTTTKVIRVYKPGLCQVQHSGVPQRSDLRNAIKLNPQPEPPSAQRK